MSAQRDCLNLAKELIADIPGPILELGLGNGRTYDHLRELFPDRDIFVFDRRVAAHPDCIPDDDHMILGDITETLSSAFGKIGKEAALAHCDIGTGENESNARLITAIAPLVDAPMLPGVSSAATKSIRWRAGWLSRCQTASVRPLFHQQGRKVKRMWVVKIEFAVEKEQLDAFQAAVEKLTP